jgi:hypothetical protein
MQWELVQNIQRIRPIYKKKVDIILAASSWPTILPEPDFIIDRSQSKNWKEIAIKQLEPFVEEFGFLNQDIGFLANVYQKSKSNIAERFQQKMFILLKDFFKANLMGNGNCSTGQLSWLEGFIDSGNTCLKAIDQSSHLEEIRRKLILVI